MDSFGRTPFPQFDEASESPGSDAGQRPRTRDSLFLMARLTFAGDPAPRDARVRNLSAGGLMAESDRVVAEGTSVSLELRGVGTVEGKVAWCTEGRIGIAFEAPIDPKKARKPVGTGATTPDYAKAFTR